MLREIISNEWITILIVLCISILAFTKATFSNRFNDFLWVIGTSKYLKVYSRKQKFIDWFEGLLFFNFVISFSLFFIILYNTFFESTAFSISFFIMLLIGIGAIILIKVLLERLIGSIFEIDSLIDSYIFQKTNYKNYIGLVLLLINILLIFAVQPTKTILYFVIGLLLIINLVGFIASFKMHQKLILNNLFYFILYICTLEIAPLILIIKLTI